jgi:hypothetical protein
MLVESPAPDTAAILLAANAPLTFEAAAAAPGTSAPASSNPAEPTHDVHVVIQKFNWQAYAGYTYVRFYEVPGATLNMNGFNGSIVYYYRGGWLGADGECVAAFGSQSGTRSHLLLGMGGPRFRWSVLRGLEVWGHALAGAARLTPQIAFGNQSGFGYEGGIGVDINSHHRRIAYRLQGDMVGTRFFGSYQYSPRISAGIVFKF